MSSRYPSVRWSLALCVGAALGASAALAAEGKATSDAQARYQQERAMCDSGQSQQDRTTCLREAGAALQEARRGQLSDGSAAQYQRNALVRCDGLPDDQRDACVARMQGQGTTSGSVAAGGIYRELITRQTPVQ